MDKQQWKKISRIFDIALTLPAERRTAYIRNLCADDPKLQEEVNALLASMEESDRMLEEHLLKNGALLNELNSVLEQGYEHRSMEGTSIDGWQVIELLGRGGMGDVYKVERSGSDIHQQGALKIMRRGLDTPENIRRFRLEKQIMAGLHHPNISSLIDGGVSNDGLPYLVMEFVEGTPLDTYCDQHKLTVRQRLELIATVCEAVQHAHKNLIVHRDLKPENILVTPEGRVKILDFGIAKLLDPDVYQFSTIETRQGMRLMSLEYAAPEQVVGEKITTSTDVYALGILLYVLLAGRHPYDLDELNHLGLEHAIRHEDPPAPSQRIRDSSKEKPVPVIHGLAKTHLADKVKGDLDGIVLKALRKEPDARYQSASQLQDDITLYLEDKPVSARNGTIYYRAQKFIRRYRWGVAAAGIVLFSLIGGFAVAYWQAQVASKERDQARIERNKSEEVTQFLTGLFEANHPDIMQGEMPTARDLLDVGVQRIDSSFRDNPKLLAELQAMLGNLYYVLGEHDEAQPLLEESLSLAKKHNDVSTQAEALYRLGLLHIRTRTSNFKKTLELLQQADRLLKEDGRAPSLKHAMIITEMQWTLKAMNRNAEALEVTKNALELAQNSSKLSQEALFGYLRAHGSQLLHARQFEEAKLIFGEALKLDFSSDQAEERRLVILEYLLDIANFQGDREKALSLQDTLLKKMNEVLPKVHRLRARIYDSISRSLIRFGRISEAEYFHREMIEILKQVHPKQSRYHLGWAHARLGLLLQNIKDEARYSEAFELLEQGRSIFEDLYDQPTPFFFRMTAHMGDILRLQGHLQESEALLIDALERSRALPEADRKSNRIVRILLAKLRLNQNRQNEALAYLDEALDSYSTMELEEESGFREINEDKRQLQEILSLRAGVLAGLGNNDEAEASYTRALAIGDQVSLLRGIPWPQLLIDYACFLAEDNDPRAPAALKWALRANEKLYGNTHPNTQFVKNLLATSISSK